MYEIPTSITIDGQEFSIRNKGDYRTILDCFSALEDGELTAQERLFSSLIIFYGDLNSVDDLDKLPNLETAIEEMYNFFNCNSPTSPGTQSNHKLVDWDQDAQLICSAVNAVSNKEIRSEPYIHWWTFMGWYTAIGDSVFSTIISIRDKIVRGKKLEKHERDFRRDNPQFFTWNSNTVSQLEANDLLKTMWNKE